MNDDLDDGLNDDLDDGLNDDWDVYFCNIEDKPASILLNLAWAEYAPLADLEDLVWLRLALQQPDEHGLCGEDEFDRLGQIEDAVAEAAEQADETIEYVGRSTCDGACTLYFYSNNGVGSESRLSSAMVAFPEYEFETGSGSDPQWSAYLEFLYPSEIEHQMIMNGRVLSQLESHGDKHEIPRQVSHWVYFSSAEDRTRFLEAVAQKGFGVTEEHDQGDDPLPLAATITRVQPIDFATINETVLDLYELAAESGGQYDGWETSLETGESGEQA